jgi:ABC-2 type transport system permease protein
MKEGILAVHPRAQLAAIAELRWRLFVNALRSKRGKLELASQILIGFAFAIGGLGGGFAMAAGAFFFISQGKPEMLALLMWPIFIFWQVFPVMASAFTDNPDSSDLLRFPLSYRSYFLVRLSYGVFDPATLLVGLWCFGILVGVSFAKPFLLPWTLFVLVAFAAFNLLFGQMIFAWVERWLAQRRTREIMGVLFILLMLSFQLVGPLLGHFGKRARPDVQHFVELIAPVQGILPPGLAADAIAQALLSQFAVSFSSMALLCAFVIVVGYFLHLRLLAQYRGENLSEVAAASAVPRDRRLRPGWNLLGFGAPVAAVFEKEVRYLLRSGPVLLTLIMPLFALLVFRFGALNSGRHSGTFLHRTPDTAFPAAAAYALLMLTNLVYNNFGADGEGIQFFYACPVNFRDIVLAKNLTHSGILIVEIFLAWIAVSVLYGAPAFATTVATLAALLFAAPINFSVGNLLSIYSPKKVDFSKFGRQRAAQLTGLIGLGVQVFVVCVGAAAFYIARHYGNMWIAAVALLILSGVPLMGYAVILNRIDNFARERQETLMGELCRA